MTTPTTATPTSKDQAISEPPGGVSSDGNNVTKHSQKVTGDAIEKTPDHAAPTVGVASGTPDAVVVASGTQEPATPTTSVVSGSPEPTVSNVLSTPSDPVTPTVGVAPDTPEPATPTTTQFSNMLSRLKKRVVETAWQPEVKVTMYSL